MRRHLGVLLFLCLAVLVPKDARAICGDVTGDERRTAADALKVLRVSVDLPDDLVCAGEGPSQLRYYNDFNCGDQSEVSVATLDGLTFQASSTATSEYQAVTVGQIDNAEIVLCDEVYSFDGPIYLPPDRAMTFWMVLLDPETYQFPDVEVPAQLVISDDGTAASALTAAPTTPRNTALIAYGGRRR